MESDEDDEETQASFCRFLDDNFKLPISAYAPDCVPKVEIKERLDRKGSGERVHKKTAMGDCRYQIINKLRIKLFHISIDILNVLIIFNFVKEVHNAFDLLVRIRDGVVSEALQVSFDNIYLACFEGIVHCSV